MAASWRDYPKIELHLHLEGAAPPALTRRIAAEKGLSAEGLFNETGGYAWRGFSGFLEAYDAVSAIYETSEDHARLAEAVLLEAASHGVIYCEIFLSPDHVSPGNRADQSAWEEHLAAVAEGAARAGAATGIIARFIPLCVRGLGPDRARRAAEVVARVGGANVVGWGMAGDERMYSASDFAPAFRAAAEAGLRLTAHAGEFGGPESVRAVLDDLRVERVGHGVRAVEDPHLVERLAAEGVTLEVNPGSNIALGVFPHWGAHPLPQLYESGVKVTISTDDPPFFDTDMTREFEMAEKAFGFSKEDFRKITTTALEAAFCDDAARARLKAQLEK